MTKPMTPVKAWAVGQPGAPINPHRVYIERFEADHMASVLCFGYGAKPVVVRVEIRELPRKGKR